MEPIYIERPDLLDEPLFWQCLYFGPLEPTAEDVFKSPNDYFGLRVSAQNANSFLDYLEAMKLPAGYYPAYFVPIVQTDNWRVGVTLHACPEDFEISFDVVDMNNKHVELGRLGGHYRLPAFRWCEVGALAHSESGHQPTKAFVTLLLLPGVWFGKGDQLPEIRDQVISAMVETNFATRRLPELTDRILGYLKYEVSWRFDEHHGWVNDSIYSYRNPDRCQDEAVFRSIRELFLGLKID